MIKTLTYLAIAVTSFMLFACSKEEIVSPDDEEFVEMPVTIEIATRNQSQLSTRATDEELAGTCNVDKIMLLIYSGPTTVTDRRQLKFDSRQIVDCNKEGGKWVARGSITGTANTNYSVFALGFNSGEQNWFQLVPSPLTVGGTTYGETKVALNYTNITGTLNRYDTPEFFAGSVSPKGSVSDVFMADGETGLTGTLYRAVGKCSFKLTNIPANIKKISWLTEKIADYNILYRLNAGGGIISTYPMGIPGEDELHKNLSEIASVQRTGNAVWQTTLSSFLLPLMNTLFYIDATDDNGNTTRYLVKCADNYSNSIWIYIIGYGVQSYRFSIPPNYQINVSGTFDQLKNSGNVLIDLSDMYEYDGGLLS